MENINNSREENLIIDLTIKSFLKDICKFLKVIYITGYVMIASYFLKFISAYFFKSEYQFLYSYNRRLYDFIHNFYYEQNFVLVIFLIGLLIGLTKKYRNFIILVLLNNKEEELAKSFYHLMMFFKFLAFS